MSIILLRFPHEKSINCINITTNKKYNYYMTLISDINSPWFFTEVSLLFCGNLYGFKENVLYKLWKRKMFKICLTKHTYTHFFRSVNLSKKNFITVYWFLVAAKLKQTMIIGKRLDISTQVVDRIQRKSGYHKCLLLWQKLFDTNIQNKA